MYTQSTKSNTLIYGFSFFFLLKSIKSVIKIRVQSYWRWFITFSIKAFVPSSVVYPIKSMMTHWFILYKKVEKRRTKTKARKCFDISSKFSVVFCSQRCRNDSVNEFCQPEMIFGCCSCCGRLNWLLSTLFSLDCLYFNLISHFRIWKHHFDIANRFESYQMQLRSILFLYFLEKMPTQLIVRGRLTKTEIDKIQFPIQ